MEELDEAYSDDSGCDYYVYEGITDEERKWLEDKLSDLMFEFHQKIGLNPRWFRVISTEEINLNDYKGTQEVRWLINYIRSCFCKHEWELIHKGAEYSEFNLKNDMPARYIWIYRCKKCGMKNKLSTD